MEILGTRIPDLQSAIASGLESVTAGVVESAKATGTSALGIAQRSFSFEQIPITSANLPAVADAGNYPGPAQYFDSFSGQSTDSLFSPSDIRRTFSDLQFSAPKVLQMMNSHFNGVADELSRNFRSQIPDMFKRQKENEIAHLSPGTIANDPHLDDSVDQGPGDLLGDDFAMKPYADRTLDDLADSEYASRGSWKADGATRFGDNDPKSAEGVGGSSNDASDRSIIVVGGKTTDTYFETLDDSINSFNQTPTVDAARILGNQLSAVSDLGSNINQSVQLQQDLASNILLRGLRG